MPVLLADRGHDRALADFMGARPRTAVAVGGKVDDDIAATYQAERLSGLDRYATMLAVARFAADRGVDTTTVTAVPGESPSVALVAGALGPVTLLVEKGDFTMATREWITERTVQSALRVSHSSPRE